MNIFVFFHEDERSEAVEEAITAQFGSENVYALSDELMAVRTYVADPRSFTGLGIGEDEGTGVIFKLNASHKGFYRPSFWQWLKEAVSVDG